MTPFTKPFLHTQRGPVKNIVFHTYSTDFVLTMMS